MVPRMRSRVHTALAVLGAMAVSACAGTSATAPSSYSVGRITNVSGACGGSNAEVEQAVDAARGYVYEEWIGCNGIGFARSTDGGRTFESAVPVPGSVGPDIHVWDPAVAVGPDGSLYASYMIAKNGDWYPVVVRSVDHGASFSGLSSLLPPDHQNMGDRDFIAVAPDGTVYVTWDYGPERTSVKLDCGSGRSCALSSGDFNAVIQKSTDNGVTWSRQSYISPGFPVGGADSAPFVIEPNGQIDVMYQGYHTNPQTYALEPAYSYFTSSVDHGQTWSAPIRLGPNGTSMPLGEWWIDGDIAMDGASNLYATWDTRGSGDDTGWLSFSTDHGKTWSTAIQAPLERLKVPHIMEVAGGGSGIAYVGWLAPSFSHGYAQYLRPFSIARGWLTDPVQVSTQFGDVSVWPGDTFGISTLGPNQLVLSWGSGVPSGGNKNSEIFAAPVSVRVLP
jgi:hypothetical protein